VQSPYPAFHEFSLPEQVGGPGAGADGPVETDDGPVETADGPVETDDGPVETDDGAGTGSVCVVVTHSPH